MDYEKRNVIVDERNEVDDRCSGMLNLNRMPGFHRDIGCCFDLWDRVSVRRRHHAVGNSALS
jgi:hypothetical protein